MAATDFAGQPHQLDMFRGRAPKKPYCTDDLTTGLRIRSIEHALRCRYIQPNNPNSKIYFVYDVDRATCIDELTDDLGLPGPSIFVQNPDNLHAHVYYTLDVAVHHNANSSMKAIRFAAAVDCAFTTTMGADAQYAGLVAKNPVHEHWRTYAGTSSCYDLSEMSEYVDLQSFNDRRKSMPETGLGRNVNLFNRLRKWAYKAIRQGWPDANQWQLACHDRALGYNQTSNPLPYPEVQHIAKSVAKWTHRNMSPAEFSAVQSSRGKRKGQSVRDEKLQLAIDLSKAGKSQRAIAEELGLARTTIQHWLKNSQCHIR